MTGHRVAPSLVAACALVALASCSTSGTKVGLSGGRPSAKRNGPIAYQRFAAARNDGRTSQIYLRQADGTERRITNVRGGAFSPAWSFDGSRIAFESGSPGRGHEIFTMNADGSGVRQVTRGCAASADCESDVSPAWSPDDQRISFLRIHGPFVEKSRKYEKIVLPTSVDLMVVGADGSGERALKRWALDPQPSVSRGLVFGAAGAPVWSPDGKQIAFATQTDPCRSFRVNGCPRDPDFEPFDLYAIGADGSGLRRLTSAPQFESHPAWGVAR